MTLDDLHNLLEPDGGKIVIVENGKPTVVVISFDAYKKHIVRSAQNNPRAQFVSNLPKELEEEPLKIEDLPV